MFKNFHNSLNSLTSISIQFTTASHTYILTHGIAKAFLSVCLFIKGVHCDKTKETCTHILITHESKFILVFRHEEWLVGGRLPCTWNFGPHWPRSNKNADFQSIFARSASAVTPAKKVQLTQIESQLRAFQWAKMYVVHKPPKGAQKRKLSKI